MSNYRDIIIETYLGANTHASRGLRARPLAGQGFDTNMNVECSTSMRNDHPVGTKFLVQARLKSKKGGLSFLYVYYQQTYKVISDQDAQDFIKKMYLSILSIGGR